MIQESPSILLVEPDLQLGEVILESLELKQYRVEWQKLGEKAMQLFKAAKYDIIVINVELEDMSGHNFVKDIRKEDFETPILFMSSSSNDRDMVHAFCAGGDDYIAKPFSTTELALRIYSLLRRAESKKEKHKPKMSNMMKFGSFVFDYSNRLLCSPQGEMNLTKKEAEVLRMLALNVNKLVKRESVLTDVWGENDYFMGRSMDVYIARLRKKLQEDKKVSIVNIHRMGFKLEVS